MKKIFLVALFFIVSAWAFFASEVGELLSKSKSAYDSGDKLTAIKYIDEAKKIIEKETLSSISQDYVEIAKWDVVKMKKDQFVGKKVKIKSKFVGINSNGTIWLSDISMQNPYDDSLVDTILDLKEYREYTFYGIVLEGGILGPSLHIEAIQ